MSVFPQRIVLRNTTDSITDLSIDSLLLHGNGSNNSTTIIDSSPVPKTVTVFGNAKISTAQSKFGGSSIVFDGTNSYLSVPASSWFAFGTSNFTIELWAYQSATPNGGTLISEQYTGSGDQISFAIGYCDGSVGSAAGSRPFFGIFTGSAWVGAAAASPLANNQWHHIAGVRLGNNWTLYVNGTSVATFTNSNSVIQDEQIFIGRRWDLAGTISYFNGYIDELRIKKGIAVYTANFTPPTAAFPDSISCAAGEIVVFRESGRARALSIDTSNETVQVTTRIKNGNKGSLTISNEGYGSTSFTLNNGSVTGNEIIDGSLTSTKISGVIGIDKGGTGQSTVATAISALLPSQTGNAGKALTSDGVNVSWTDYPILAAAVGNPEFPEGQTLSIDGIPDVNTPLNPSNTSLLLRGDGANNSTTIVDSSPNVKSLTRFGDTKISTTQSKFGGSSILFDGNGDYLSVATSAEFVFGTGDFTVEAWIYQVSQNLYSSLLEVGNHANTNAPLFLVGTDGLKVYAGGFFGSGTLSTNQWQHVAWTRSSGTLRTFINGTITSTTTFTNNLTATAPISIGYAAGYNGGANYYLNGYVDDLRIVKGSALYTANFTPPTTAHPAPATIYLNQSLKWDSSTAKWIQAEDVTVPIPWGAGAPGKAGQLSKDSEYLYVCVAANTWKRIPYSAWATSLANPPLIDASTSLPVPRAVGVADPFYPNTSLLLHFDGANGSNVYTDTSQNAFSGSPVNGAVLSTAQSKFGGSSGFFNNASSQYVIFANNSAFHFGSGNFTIEAWIRLTAITSEHCICSHSFGVFNSHIYTFSVNGSTQMKFRLHAEDGATTLANYQPAFSLTTNTWYHVAAVRNGNLLRIFVNGALPPTDLSVTTTLHSPSTPDSTFKVGAATPFNNSTPSLFFPGYIDDLRVTKGVARYWTAFTPPAYAFPDIG